MSATSVTLRGRAAAERLMLDTCTVRRVTSSTTDPETGVVTPTSAVIYSGKCKVQQAAPGGSVTDVGQAAVTVSQLALHVPTSAAGITTDDVATIDASALDAELVGKVFRITGPAHKSFTTARRYAIQEVTS